MLKLGEIHTLNGFFFHLPSFGLYCLTSVEFYFKNIRPYDHRLMFHFALSRKEMPYWNRPKTIGLLSFSNSL